MAEVERRCEAAAEEGRRLKRELEGTESARSALRCRPGYPIPALALTTSTRPCSRESEKKAQTASRAAAAAVATGREVAATLADAVAAAGPSPVAEVGRTLRRALSQEGALSFGSGDAPDAGSDDARHSLELAGTKAAGDIGRLVRQWRSEVAAQACVRHKSRHPHLRSSPHRSLSLSLWSSQGRGGAY